MKISYRPILGIDFSGAKDAGNKIWVAFARITNSRLIIERCSQISKLEHGHRDRENALGALRQLIVESKNCIAGLDFPFGLSRQFVTQNRWDDFVRAFPHQYSDPDDFRDLCKRAAGGKEPKRKTDTDSKTPFAPQNIRLFRQTYYGIRDVLFPLLESDSVRVLPMQQERKDRPVVIEVCPASTLKKLSLYNSYKGSGPELRKERAAILRKLTSTSKLSVPDRNLREVIIDDKGGDALDSVIAAYAVYRNLIERPVFSAEENKHYAIEGYVYS